MLQIVPLPVQDSCWQPSPKNSMMEFVPPLVDRMPESFRITSLALTQPLNLPVSFTPMILGIFSSHSMPINASTRSAPPTPMASMPMPPAVGVWLSVTSIMAPGKS